jgi:MFS superfamily sulfate permease-like transporter
MAHAAIDLTDRPKGNLAGFKKYLKQDITAGFLVFLIALPLCLGISIASGYPPIAGIFTAIIGSILTSLISNSELTIKGPAAGMIVIVIGCVQDFGGDGTLGGWTAVDGRAYQAALAVGVVAAGFQILFGMFRGGILGEFFPISTVHGMLAAIGVIIILKQFPVALGVSAKGEPLELLREIPHFIMEANPAIACIGLVSLLIMFFWPSIRAKLGPLQAVPAALVVLVVAIPMGMGFDLLHDHNYMFHGHKYPLNEQFLVKMPDHIFGMFEEVTLPDFSVLTQFTAWKWILMFFMIGSLESMLSAKAVDLIDPWKRKTNMNRDMLAVGVANMCASMVGGLPMISEIVRSRANIDNGARTRFADFWHGMFLLGCVALIPTFLHRIPLAALAAMLVYTGFRLAHPKEFINVYRIGREQLAIFACTLIAVLATDLLIGIAIGIAVKFTIHIINGVPISSLFKPYLEVEQQGENACVIRAYKSAVFSNWIPFKRTLENLGLVQKQNITLDLSNTKLVDHSVMEKLHEMQSDFEQEGLTLDIVGLDLHVPVAKHDFSARRGKLARMQRLTVFAPAILQETLESVCLDKGAAALTVGPCQRIVRRELAESNGDGSQSQVRIEVLAPAEVCDRLLVYLRQEVVPQHRITACVELVSVLQRDALGTATAESASHPQAAHAR